MKSREYYISLILSHAEELKSNFGVKSLRLFGSVSRNEQKEGSDVDICVDIVTFFSSLTGFLTGFLPLNAFGLYSGESVICQPQSHL